MILLNIQDFQCIFSKDFEPPARLWNCAHSDLKDQYIMSPELTLVNAGTTWTVNVVSEINICCCVLVRSFVFILRF
jgi:hypothetical protein